MAWSSATPTRSLVASWQLNDRELPGGGTPAQRYARLAGLTDSERAIARRIASARLALLRVRSTEPGRAIEIEDVTRGSLRARVVSHEVSSYVRTNDMFVGHLMPGPPSASLWGPMAMLDRRAGRELLDLLDERIALLGLDPYSDNVLGVAIGGARGHEDADAGAAARIPAARAPPGARRLAQLREPAQRRRLCLRAARCALRLARRRADGVDGRAVSDGVSAQQLRWRARGRAAGRR